MLFATTEELELQGIYCNETSQIIFQNKRFNRTADFPKNSRIAAIKLCQEYLKSHHQCLMVENHTTLTVWVEEKQVNPPNEDASLIKKFAKPKFTGSSLQAAAKSNDPVQTYLKSRNSTDEQPSTSDDLPSQNVLFQLFSKNETSSDSIQDKELDDFEPPASAELTLEEKPSAKKPTKRKYRGISY